MATKKNALRISLIGLVVIFVIAFFLGINGSFGQSPISLSYALASMNWPIFIFLLVLIIINIVLYIKVKD